MHKRHSQPGIRSFSHGFKGLLGNIASYMFYPPVLIAWLHRLRGVKFKSIRKVFLSFNVCIDNVFPELVSIGQDVWICRNATILAHFNPSEMQRQWLGDIVAKEVVIEDGVFIGVHAIILPGVTIGEGAMVGAGAVVTKDVPPRTMVAGNPARVIRQLDAKDLAGETKEQD